MASAPAPFSEAQRLRALREYEVLDTPRESNFDEITALAAQICGTPMAAITLLDENRQWFKAKVGLTSEQTPRDIAFCAYALHGTDLLIYPM